MQNSTKQSTGDQTHSDKDDKKIDVGYGKDTGMQHKPPTAGGREGTFSSEDESEMNNVERQWRPSEAEPSK